MLERFISFSFKKRQIFLGTNKHTDIFTWDGRHNDSQNKGLDIGVGGEGCCLESST